ncbi:MAG: T9SS type A sorting domain-containing protein [Ignavibacteriae bacterium]|nr:T9SS type A sorting domain-containing protein [Ignavibacteriota bacterium]MCB9214860.1 T9SS type A sorting domain-containing protein [Ignavibacteria bacterium]
MENMMQQFYNPVRSKGRDILQGGRTVFFGVLLFLAGVLSTFAQTIQFTSNPYELGKAPAKITTGITYGYRAKAEASDGSRIEYSLRFGPAGMQIDRLSGLVQWRPNDIGEVEVEVQAELANDPSVKMTQRWTISVMELIGHPGCIGESAWTPLGGGVSGWVKGAMVMNDELYLYYQANPSYQADPKSVLSKWNGEQWTILTKPGQWDTSERAIAAYRGDVYIATAGSSVSQLDLIQWDGTAAKGVGFAGNHLLFVEMEAYDDALYAVAMVEGKGNYGDIIIKWDGASWTLVYGNDSRDPKHIAQVNGKLYASGYFENLGTSGNVPTLAEIDGDQLVPVSNAPTDLIYRITPHQGGLVLVHQGTNATIGRLELWTPSSTTPILENPYLTQFAAPMISYNGDLYATSTYIGPKPSIGQAPLITDIWKLSNGEWLPVSSLKGEKVGNFIYPAKFIIYRDDLYAYGTFTESCGSHLPYIARLCKEGECGQVSGVVFRDDDRNCAQTPGERSLGGELIEFQPGSYFVTTERDGAFSTFLPIGTYTASVIPKRHWITTCGEQEVDLATSNSIVGNLIFGTDVIPGIHDVRVSLISSRARRGGEFVYTLLYQNAGTESATGRVWIDFDDRLTFKSATVDPNRQIGNHLEWDFVSLQVGEQVTIDITTTIPTAMELGEKLCATSGVELEKRDDDRLLSDNEDSTCTLVLAAFDPNDIQVLPHNALGELGEETLYPEDTVLTYIVRFQNTGNDTAFKVVVVDTISHYTLDVPSIELGVASHPYTFAISGQGVLTWTFDNIMLPDSGTNQSASNGYFKYRVHLKRGLSPRTEISNRASIYFDYNDPVLTNQVVSVTGGTSSVDEEELASSILRVYPNPARELSMISLQLLERSNLQIRLVDAKGSILQTLVEGELGVGEHHIKLETGDLSSGLYFITLEREGEKEVFPVVVGR